MMACAVAKLLLPYPYNCSVALMLQTIQFNADMADHQNRGY